MRKFLHELWMFFLGLCGLIAFTVGILLFVVSVPYGQQVFTFLALFAVIRIITELVFDWLENKKKDKGGQQND